LAGAPLGRALFGDPLNPPSYRALDASESARVDLGQAVFNTQWVPAGIAGAMRRDGVGPLFNSASCDACHNDGARGRGPAAAGRAPAALVVQLGTREPDGTVVPQGDPAYGRVFNTAALEGVAPEGVVMIRYRMIEGRYPDGTLWSLRSPQYELTDLRYGPLQAGTLIKPRLAPALFGVGLLEAVPVATILAGNQGDPAWQERAGERMLGRFGWQGESVSIREQTAKAFALEMGLTSGDHPHDDCTAREEACVGAPNGGSPEVAAELLDAVVAFQGLLAVPQSVAVKATRGGERQRFTALGCAACHRPSLPLSTGSLAAYTDLRLHDLGEGLADETVSGVKVKSRWRTAPLWGVGYRPRASTQITLLHDGRARSIEEAILWHAGEGGGSRERFERLPAQERHAFLNWLETL
jgi:CxxC motif-containing protein (DUF1111 family)